MPTKQEFYERAREQVGTPFRHQGRSPGQALDCLGLLACTAKSFGMEVNDAANYREYADWTQFIAKFKEHGELVGNKSRDLVPGYVVVLRDGEARRVHQTHCGVIGAKDGSLTLIHAYKPRGKVVEERFTLDWDRRLAAVFSLRGVD